MEHYCVTFRPEGTAVSIHRGATLLEAAGKAGIILEAACGGAGTCGKCGVMLLPQRRMVQACRQVVDRDMEVLVPGEARFLEHRILEEGGHPGAPIEPDVYRRYAGRAAPQQVLGAAVDVGTTTVVLKLMRMVDGQVLATESALNPQARFGDDVISRIDYAGREGGARQLREAIVGCINDLLARACRKASAEVSQVYEMCVAGNTTMHHLLLGLPVAQLGSAPYRAHCVEAMNLEAGPSGLAIHPEGKVHVLANIAGFVGADTTAAALATEMAFAEDGTLLVDIGTNGELVLAAGGRLTAASCAAGPAFEGARITCGSRAATGAIEAVVFDGQEIALDIIGGGPPRSICGSGLVDAVAVMLEAAVIDPTGRFVEEPAIERLSEPIRHRLRRRNGEPCLMLYEPSDDSRAVFLTQRDIRQVQLAKAAIRAGISLLLRRSGLAEMDLRAILLAGAFGNYIRRENAVRIGLLPDVDIHHIRFVGNAAGAGAQVALLSQAARERAAMLARRIEYMEIANEAGFTDVYTQSMLF